LTQTARIQPGYVEYSMAWQGARLSEIAVQVKCRNTQVLVLLPEQTSQCSAALRSEEAAASRDTYYCGIVTDWCMGVVVLWLWAAWNWVLQVAPCGLHRIDNQHERGALSLHDEPCCVPPSIGGCISTVKGNGGRYARMAVFEKMCLICSPSTWAFAEGLSSR